MNNILRLTKANIRKSISQAVSLLIFVLIAALLLSTGLTIFTGLNAFVEERAEAVNTPHFTAIYETGFDTIEEGQRFMENRSDVVEIERLDLVGGNGTVFIHDIEAFNLILLSRVDNAQRMDAPNLIGESQTLTGTGIYIPYSIFIAGGFELGDDIKLEVLGIEFNFTIAGATEEIAFGTDMGGLLRFYIPDQRFDEIKNELPNPGITLLSARLENRNELVFFGNDYNREISSDGLYYYPSIDGAIATRTMIPTIVTIVITAFALILLAISLIVIRFRIINSIEESMVNIGAQKAVGYRSVQIILSIVFQFGITALIGGILGVAISQFVTPVITGIFKPMMGLIWVPGFNIVIALLSILTVTLAVALVSYITSRRVNKLQPLTALRGGLATHSFKKNSLPLEKSKAPVTVLLAIKHLFQNKKQAITIGMIVALVTVASVVAVAANHSMNEGSEDFARAVFGEVAEAGFILTDETEVQGFKERMENRPEVRKVLGYSFYPIQMIVEDISIIMLGVEDSSGLEGGMLVRGRYPIHDNEVALGLPLLTTIGKTTGDTITIGYEGSEQEYLVTGVVQFMNGNGFNGLITSDGIRRMQPDFILADVCIYLYPDVDVQAFIDSVTEEEGNVFNMVLNMHSQMEASLASMGGIFSAVAIGIVSITVFVIVLTLYMVLKTVILRRRQELGIQKAIGFTTLQLMNQIALNMIPVITVGVVIGALAGYFGFNPMMMAFTAGMGVAQLSLPVMLDQVIIVCIALIAVAYIVSMLIAVRIRKISAYTLVTE